ncbi:MAG: hypothetical protein AAF631_09230 [Pseudomonadota bacterium]
MIGTLALLWNAGGAVNPVLFTLRNPAKLVVAGPEPAAVLKA